MPGAWFLRRPGRRRPGGAGQRLRSGAFAPDCPIVILVAACGGCLRIPSGLSTPRATRPPPPRAAPRKLVGRWGGWCAWHASVRPVRDWKSVQGRQSRPPGRPLLAFGLAAFSGRDSTDLSWHVMRRLPSAREPTHLSWRVIPRPLPAPDSADLSSAPDSTDLSSAPDATVLCRMGEARHARHAKSVARRAQPITIHPHQPPSRHTPDTAGKPDIKVCMASMIQGYASAVRQHRPRAESSIQSAP